MKIKIKISNKKLSFPGIKVVLGVLTVTLLAGITFSVVQITMAGVTGPHDPGHTWSILDKPLDCPSGSYVHGADDSGWLCNIPTDTWITTQTCSSGQYLSSVGKTTKTCSTPTGAASYWTRDAYNSLYPSGNPNISNIMVAIGDFAEPVAPYTGARLSVKAGLGTGALATIGIDSRGQTAGGYFQNTTIYGADAGARAFLGYNTGGDLYGIYAAGKYAGGYFKDDDSSTYAWVAASGGYSILGNGIIQGSSKQFSIDHPTKPGIKLVHASIEGPENAVFYRGEGQLLNGLVEIQLSDYFEALVRDGGRTVLLTPKFESESEKISQLAASAVLNGKFTVRSADDNNPNQKFYWEVKAVREDIPVLEVEQPADNFPESPK